MAIATSTNTLTFTRTINASATQLYTAFTDRDHLDNWLGDGAHLRLAVGGHLLTYWQDGNHMTGQYLELDSPTRLAFTWRLNSETHDSRVDVTITEADNTAELTLVHSDLSPDADLDAYTAQWDAALDNLVSSLETGADLRITQRIILGVIPGNFDADVAKRLGVPSETGVRITDVLDGFSAAASGLQADDVIVAIGDVALTPDNNIFAIIQQHNLKPGDTTSVTYYRGADKHTADLQLKGYPVPPLPDSFTALAQKIRTRYDDQLAQLDALLADMTDAEATAKPDGEWSVVEVIAHLTLHERWIQNHIGGYLQAPVPAGYTCNTQPRIDSLTTIYPDKTAIRAALGNAFAETVALIAHIPDAVLADKSAVWWINFELDQFQWHMQQHLTQITDTLAAIRT